MMLFSIIFGLLIFSFVMYALYRSILIIKNNRPKIKFIANSSKLMINEKIYKYSDIKDISIDEDITEYSSFDKYVTGDYAHGRLINDRINFTFTNNELVESIETYNRNQLYDILKSISKFKRLNFNIDKYKPPIVTEKEFLYLIFVLVVIYIIFHV